MSYDCACDYDPPEFCHVEIRTARKLHKCEECAGKIIPGETYEHVRGKWEGHVSTIKTCERCVDIRTWVKNNVPCFCWAFGNIIDDAKAAVDALRSLPCLACGLEGQSQAAHIRFSSAKDGKRNPGLGRRPDDSACVPLCDTCHRDQHAVGDERAWWDAQSIDPLKAANALHRAPDNETQRQVVALFRAAQLIERQT